MIINHIFKPPMLLEGIDPDEQCNVAQNKRNAKMVKKDYDALSTDFTELSERVDSAKIKLERELENCKETNKKMSEKCEKC